MAYKKFLFSIFLVSSGLPCTAMNLEESEIAESQSEQQITIQCSDGRAIGVPLSIALQTAFMRDYPAFTQDESPSIELSDNIYSGVVTSSEQDDSQTNPLLKKVLSYIPYTQLTQKLLNQPINGLEEGSQEQLERLNLNADILEKVFDCIEKPDIIQELPPEEINPLFEAADYLGAPHAVLRELTLHAMKNLPERPFHRKITSGHYCNSIGSLYAEGLLNNALVERNDEQGNLYGTLNFHNKQLDTLEGLEHFLEKYKDTAIRIVNFKKNNLRILDLTFLLALLPELQEVNAKNNAIHTLISPPQLPGGLTLNLNNNCLKNLPLFKAGEGGIIKLKKNPLNQESRTLALRAIQPTLFEERRHIIKAVTDKPLLKRLQWGCFAGGGITLLSLIIPYLVLSYVHKQVQHYSPRQRERFHDQVGNALFELSLNPSILGYVAYMSQSPVVQLCGVVTLCLGLCWAYIYYKSYGYNNNLIHQFKPATLTLGEEDAREKEAESDPDSMQK